MEDLVAKCVVRLEVNETAGKKGLLELGLFAVGVF